VYLRRPFLVTSIPLLVLKNDAVSEKKKNKKNLEEEKAPAKKLS
jgi:hypothetical protein